MTIDTPTILLSSQLRDPMSRVIQWGTASACSHAAIGGLTFDGIPVVLEATISGVHTTLRDQFFAKNHVLHEFLVNVPVDVEGAIRCMGERYDVPRILGFIPVIVARWIGKKLRNPLHSPHSLICSELVQQLDPKGLHVPAWRDFYPTTPGDLCTVALADPVRFTDILPRLGA